jgi:tRNA nucleotidyltransferase (CCA-adding enzyme)
VSADSDLERLDALVPAPVREVCQTLAADGHQAVTVGGAVRDAMLGRTPGDWDVATSAAPDRVVALFRRTIPTGIQHGTVTVMAGRGPERLGVEVTTFRGEGAYSDARRPDEVVFGVPLDEDLARRDFVVNAIAWDPLARQLHDPFGGRGDLAARVLRAVGDAAARFGEDGLRIVRAIRFVAVLDFALDPATEAAIPGALPSLAKVSRERVRVELVKLLGAPAAGRALEIGERTGILGQVLPELAAVPPAIARVVAAPADPVVRTAALLLDLAPDAALGALRRLTYSNADRERVVALVRAIPALPTSPSDAELRRLLARTGKALAGDVGALRPDLAERLEVAARAPVTAGDLALKGPDVMRILGVAPGPAVGQAIRALLERVLDDPSLNTGEALERLLRDHISDDHSR